ncbi:box C/D snoRNA protein 1 [Bacillus rossius redtenbacheri]|uniref:box C/D snoRNA protein 1 n=1 Tax=Bacillus rossius redtenbacheri TaxID=93214 RepID=UPI002FDED820
MPPLKTSRLGRCEVCDDNDAKYACPRCEVKTCCLSCIKIHKKELSCSGQRDRVAYKPLNRFTNMDLQSDYTLLEETSRRIEIAARDPCKYYTRLGDLPVHLHRLKKAAIERTIHLDFLPKNFSRHKANTTYLNWHTRSISWHVEWVFAQANITCVDDRLPEDERLAVLASKYLDPARCDEALGESLQFYHSQGLEGAALLLKTEHPSRFYELDPSATLGGGLRGKYLIEFPTIHVVLKDHRHAYPIVDSDDEEFGSFKSVPPRFNGYMNTALPRNKQDNFLFYNSDSDNPDDGKRRQKERPLQNS